MSSDRREPVDFFMNDKDYRVRNGQYKMQFKCRNCGEEFTEWIEKGRKVVNPTTEFGKLGDKVYTVPEEDEASIQDRNYIECPVCGTGKDVEVRR